MSALIKNIILILLVFSSNQNLLYGQSREIFVCFASARSIDTTYLPTWITRSYPNPSEGYKVSGQIYKLEFAIKLNGRDFTYSEPLVVTCNPPGSKPINKIINKDSLMLKPDKLYKYNMVVGSKSNGWAKITVRELNRDTDTKPSCNGIMFISAYAYLN